MKHYKLQTDLFESFRMPQGYSHLTSKPPYIDLKTSGAGKIAEDKVVEAIRLGASCLLEISERANMVQSTVAGRVNDAIKAGRIRYEGTTTYRNRLRKKLVIVE